MIFLDTRWVNLYWDIYLEIGREGLHFELTFFGIWCVFSIQNVRPLIEEYAQ